MSDISDINIESNVSNVKRHQISSNIIKIGQSLLADKAQYLDLRVVLHDAEAKLLRREAAVAWQHHLRVASRGEPCYL